MLNDSVRRPFSCCQHFALHSCWHGRHGGALSTKSHSVARTWPLLSKECRIAFRCILVQVAQLRCRGETPACAHHKTAKGLVQPRQQTTSCGHSPSMSLIDTAGVQRTVFRGARWLTSCGACDTAQHSPECSPLQVMTDRRRIGFL